MRKISCHNEVDVDELMEEVAPIHCILMIGSADCAELPAFRRSYDGPIYMFEPDTRWYKELDEIALKHNCFVEKVALSSQAGNILLYKSLTRFGDRVWRYSNTTQSDIIPYAQKTFKLSFAEGIEVPCTTLDFWAKEKDLEEIDLIWIDVEGAEREVLKGSTESINRARYILLEYYLLSSMGISIKDVKQEFLKDFTVIYIDNMNVLFKRTRTA